MEIAGVNTSKSWYIHTCRHEAPLLCLYGAELTRRVEAWQPVGKMRGPGLTGGRTPGSSIVKDEAYQPSYRSTFTDSSVVVVYNIFYDVWVHK